MNDTRQPSYHTLDAADGDGTSPSPEVTSAPLGQDRWAWSSKLGLSVVAMPSDSIALNQIVMLYREIFGNDPAWQEGAYCAAEGWKARVSLAEYERRAAGGSACCPRCGATLLPCHSDEKLLCRMRELAASPEGYGLVLLDREHRPRGFSWGLTGTLAQSTEALVRTRYGGREAEGRRDVERLMKVVGERGTTATDRILYGEEIAIGKSSRSFEATMLLAEAIFSQGIRRNVGRMWFWTSPRSGIYPFARCVGFQPVMEVADGVEYLALDDLAFAARMLREMPPARFAIYCARALRALGIRPNHNHSPGPSASAAQTEE